LAFFAQTKKLLQILSFQATTWKSEGWLGIRLSFSSVRTKDIDDV